MGGRVFDRRRGARGIQVGIIVTLLLHLMGVIYSFGRVTNAIETIDRRVERIERLIDEKALSSLK